MRLRLLAFEDRVLSQWTGDFVVWGAGRDGKEFIKQLSPEALKRVTFIVDVDEKKIKRGIITETGIFTLMLSTLVC